MPCEGAGRGAVSRMDMKRARTLLFIQDHHLAAIALKQAQRREVHLREELIVDAAREERHPAPGGTVRGIDPVDVPPERTRRERRQQIQRFPDPGRSPPHEGRSPQRRQNPQPLARPKRHRQERQAARMGEEMPQHDPLHRPPQPRQAPGRVDALAGDGHQIAIAHTGRAGRLAGAA